MNIQNTMLKAIEEELHRQVARLNQPSTSQFYEMLTYHMGWTGENAGPLATGKRIRPLLVLLTTAACNPKGGSDISISIDWLHAVSGAAIKNMTPLYSAVFNLRQCAACPG